MECKICGNKDGNKIYIIKERILNKGDRFRYLLCGRCQTLQLADNVEDIEFFYSNYRVYKNTYHGVKKNPYQKAVWQLKMKLYLNIPLKEQIMRERWEEYLFLWALRNTHIKKSDYILDVGCGSGMWLEQMAEAGFRHLYGIDKYADPAPGKWKFRKGDIYAAEKRKYDCITMHHSFEHMDRPYEVLRMVGSLLKDKGICIIRIPVFGKEAWKRYGTDWYQIDAPRHSYVYSGKALRYLCKKAGLEVFRVIYDSDCGQILYSEGYRDTDLGLYELADKRKSPSKVKRMQAEAVRLNESGEGDQAIFYIRKRRKSDES